MQLDRGPTLLSFASLCLSILQQRLVTGMVVPLILATLQQLMSWKRCLWLNVACGHDRKKTQIQVYNSIYMCMFMYMIYITICFCVCHSYMFISFALCRSNMMKHLEHLLQAYLLSTHLNIGSNNIRYSPRFRVLAKCHLTPEDKGSSLVESPPEVGGFFGKRIRGKHTVIMLQAVAESVLFVWKNWAKWSSQIMRMQGGAPPMPTPRKLRPYWRLVNHHDPLIILYNAWHLDGARNDSHETMHQGQFSRAGGAVAEALAHDVVVTW